MHSHHYLSILICINTSIIKKNNFKRINQCSIFEEVTFPISNKFFNHMAPHYYVSKHYTDNQFN